MWGHLSTLFRPLPLTTVLPSKIFTKLHYFWTGGITNDDYSPSVADPSWSSARFHSGAQPAFCGWIDENDDDDDDAGGRGGRKPGAIPSVLPLRRRPSGKPAGAALRGRGERLCEGPHCFERGRIASAARALRSPRLHCLDDAGVGRRRGRRRRLRCRQRHHGHEARPRNDPLRRDGAGAAIAAATPGDHGRHGGGG